MRGIRIQLASIVSAGALLVAGAAPAQTEVDFVASSPAHAHAANAYKAIWDEHGERIVAALENRTCLRFPELDVSAVIDDAASHSGGPEHPMGLRATYARDAKQSTLVHELGHRHLWQLAERLDDVDGHETLYLVLDRVWADVWGENFAADSVRRESGWDASYDYAAAWTWARSLAPTERARLWNRLLVMNGFPGTCNSSTTRYRATPD
jgi:hypothetical protein